MKATCTKLFLLCLLGWLWLPVHKSEAQNISTVAGSGTTGGGGDGSQAVNASVNPMGVAVDAQGNIYIADTDNNRIRKVNALTGVISTVAGTGAMGYSGDGAAGTSARLNKPYDVAIDGAGHIYFSDQNNNRIRRISATDGNITTVAGNALTGSGGDGGPAVNASLNRPAGITLDAAGNLYIADQNNHRIRKVNASDGTIATVAGTGAFGFLGDGGPAVAAAMRFPLGIALDGNGNIYFADSGNNRIRKVTASTGGIQTIAGTGVASSSGDGGLATGAALNKPTGLAISGSGTLFISEQLGNRIRKVNPADGKIYAVAGPGLSGPPGYVGDNGPAINALLNGPTMIDVDADANLFVADYYHMRIRRIEGFVNQGLTLVEGETGSLSNALLEFIDTTHPPASVTYTLSGIPANGLLFRDDNGNDQAEAGEALALHQTFTQADIQAGLMKYKHNGSETTADHFTFSVTDGAGKNLSGKSFVITIRKFNDAPAFSDGAPGSWSTPEDQPLRLGNLQIQDPDAGSDYMSMTLSVSHGKLQVKEDVFGGLTSWEIRGNQSNAIQIDGQLSTINATLADAAGLVFLPDADFNGSDEVLFTINDNGTPSTGINGAQIGFFSKPLLVAAVNDPPLITSNGGEQAASLSIDEKTTAVTTVAATDVANEHSTLTYSLSGGADQALFAIDPLSGVLSFVTAPDFRLPADADADNTYLVKVRVTDDGAPAPAASDEQELSVAVLDKTPPRVSSILRLAPAEATTKADPVVFRVTFDEAVGQVDAADFSLTRTGTAAGSVAGVSAAAGSQFDVTVSGVAGDGTLRLEVDAGTASLSDAAGLALAESFAGGEAYTIDNTAPVISGVADGLFYATDLEVSFNEGTATLNGSPFAASTLGAEGHYTLAVTDAAGNATTLSFDIDKTAPTGTLVIDAGQAQTRQTGVSLALSTADGLGSQTAGMRFSHDNSTWTPWEPYAASKAFELPAGDGLKTVYLQLRDAVGNVSAAISDDIHLDQTLPTVLMSSTASGDSVNAPFPVTITFSEDVAGFEPADLVVTNGSASGFTALDARHFTVLITPAAEGWTKVALAENMAQDLAGNGNEAAETLIRFFDATGPALAISGPAANQVNAPFTATFTFSEPVSGFAAGDIEVGNAVVSNFQAQNGAVYTATISPVAQGPVTVAAAAGAAADPAGNASQAGLALVRNFDDIRPLVSIAAPAADPVNAAFTATVTFSEAVSGFDAGDLQVSNGTVSNFTAQSALVYSALITPAADGLVSVAVAAGVAADAAANGNEAAATLSRSFDATKPVVTLAGPAGDPVNAPFTATVTFSEAVSGFDAGDLQVSNGTVSGFTAQSALVYTALITPAADGLVSIAVGADAAADAAANGNEAAATLSRTFDGTQPTVSISAPAADPVNTAFTATFTFSEAVSGFTAGDIQVTNGTVSGFTAQSASVYTALVTPAADGPVSVAVAANAAADAAANGNEAAASLSRTFDGTRPALVLSAPAANPVNAAFTATVTFSEAVSGFDAGDLQVSNGTVSGFSAQSALVYTALITPAADGLVSLAVGAGAAADAAANGNEAAASLSRTFDGTLPTVSISAPAADPVNTAFTATFTFSEAVSGFTAGDIQVSNGSVSGFTAQSASVYTALVTPSADGPVSVAVGANAAADAAANGNEAAASLSRTFDGTRPMLAISAAAGDPLNAAFTATFTFTEPVTGFTAADVAVSNGTASDFSAQSATVYTALISPMADGQVMVAVGANAAADAAANGNEAAAALSRTYDATSPVLAISAAVPAQVNAAFTATFTFSEPVSGFAAGDIGVGNGAVSGFQAQSASVYSALITPASDGPVLVAVAAAAAADAAGNGNGAAAPLSRTYDATLPGVTLASTAAAVTNASPIPVSISFTEAVAGFVAGDITVSNGAVTSFTVVDAKTYQALISPLADGPVGVQVAAQVAADAAGNANTASGQLQYLFDGSKPQVAVASPAPAWVNASFPVSFVFNEPVTGFSAAAITVANGSLSNFTALSATQYSATLTPAAAGLVSVSVGAGKAFDAAANGNQASQVLSWNYDAVVPTVTLASATAQALNAPFQVQINFSEAVTGFGPEDIAVNNGQASGLTQTGTQTYSALITPAGEGQVQVQVAAAAAADQAGNASSASAVLGRTYDATRPAVVLASPVAAITSVNPIPVSITFSEPVADFALADLTVSGGTAGSLTGSGTAYQVLVSPSGDGIISVEVAAGVASDQAGNGNLASSLLSRTFDGSRPGVVITALTNELIRLPFVATITFSEPVTGFVAGDLEITNATYSNFQALSATVYTVLITPAPLGTVVVKVPENVAADQLQNGNLAAVPLVVEDVRCGNSREKVMICHKGQMICVSLSALPGHLGHGDNLGSCPENPGQPLPSQDVTRPEVAITAPVSGPVQGAFTATFTFSEPVSGFALNDIEVSNGAASNFTALSATVYTATITPAAKGLVTVGVGAGAATDAANNGNQKANSLSVEFLQCGTNPIDIAISRNDDDKSCGKNTYPATPGLDPETIYLGYGDQSVGLDATEGAAAGTTYAWTGNGVLSSKTSGKPVFAPSAAGVYTFHVVATNRNGCQASGSVTLTVVDVRYGPKKDKIAVCHNGQVVGLSPGLVAAHLAHGDKLGSCSSGRSNARMELTINQVEQVELGVYPNPAKVQTNIEFTLVEAGSYRLALYDLKGTLVKDIAAGQAESQQFISRQLDVRAYPQGVYLIRLTTPAKVVTRRLLIEK